MTDKPAISTQFTIRQLGVSDALIYRDIRLEGLSRNPEAFGASWDDEAGKPLARSGAGQ